MAPPRGIKSIKWLKNRTTTQRGGNGPQTDTLDRSTPDSLALVRDAYLEALTIHNYATGTINGRRHSLKCFLAWAADKKLYSATEFTRFVLEDYQHWLWHYRKPNGELLGSSAQRNRLCDIKEFFRWLTRQDIIPHNPASELELPRKERRLPRAVLAVEEINKLMAIHDLSDPLGVRNRTMLEFFYSTGIRRAELCKLQLQDVNVASGTLHIHLGKGRKDRLIPLGKRTIYWLERYLKEGRSVLCPDAQAQALFVTCYGDAFSPDVVSCMVSGWLKLTGLKRKGCCHVFRHSCATHMLDNGADIRIIQRLLGHAKLDTTAIYTEVSIKQLKKVHSKCHPAANLDPVDIPSQNEQNPLPQTPVNA
jgi:integrase/recombinase XerD